MQAVLCHRHNFKILDSKRLPIITTGDKYNSVSTIVITDSDAKRYVINAHIYRKAYKNGIICTAVVILLSFAIMYLIASWLSTARRINPRVELSLRLINRFTSNTGFPSCFSNTKICRCKFYATFAGFDTYFYTSLRHRLKSGLRNIQIPDRTTNKRSHQNVLKRKFCHQVSSLDTLTYRVRISEWLLVAVDTIIRSGYVKWNGIGSRLFAIV